MDFDLLIKDSFTKLSDEFEIRKSLFLNILHLNIDKLVEHSPDWFGKNVPHEFIEILNSLVNLSVSYFDHAQEYQNIFVDFEKNVINPGEIVHEVKIDFCEMLKITKFYISENLNEDNRIMTSRNIFKDSLYNIFLVLSHYINYETSINVGIYREQSSLKIDITFQDLSENTPELQKLLKLFYTVEAASRYNLRIGFNIVIDYFKRIGAIINFLSFNDNREITAKISFPSYAFLQTVNDIRKLEINENTEKKEGVVILSLDDKLAEVIIRDALIDNGYDVRLFRLEKIKFFPEFKKIRALVVDYRIIKSKFNGSIDEFYNNLPVKKTIIIYKSDDTLPVFAENERIMLLKMPFDLDKVAEIIG